MSFNFPSSPSNGQTYTDAVSGAQYIFSNGVWMQVSAAQIKVGSPFKRSVIVASSTSFQYDATTLYADVEVVGGGGGGGGTGGSSGAGTASAGSGGGAAGYAKKLITVDAAIRAVTKTIVIGAGGVGSTTAPSVAVASSYTDGVNTLTGLAGGAGIQGVFATQIGVRQGGAGGGGTGGDLNIRGNPGGPGQSYGNAAVGAAGNAASSAGSGGASAIGSGGLGQGVFTSSASGGGVGGNGEFGGGGGGGMGYNAVGAAQAGGSGGNGCVIITEYR